MDIVIGVIVLGWLVWLAIASLRYVRSGAYEADTRLEKVLHNKS